MRKENNSEDSLFYKQNMKIQKNIWKPYTIVLIISFIVVLVKGIN